MLESSSIFKAKALGLIPSLLILISISSWSLVMTSCESGCVRHTDCVSPEMCIQGSCQLIIDLDGSADSDTLDEPDADIDVDDETDSDSETIDSDLPDADFEIDSEIDAEFDIDSDLDTDLDSDLSLDGGSDASSDASIDANG